MYDTKDDEYEYYRELYLESIKNKKFPFAAAYYYYMQNIDRIDVMGFAEFQQEIVNLNRQCATHQEALDLVSKPVYDALDKYYSVTELISKTNVTIGVF